MLSNEIMVETRVADLWEYGRLLGIVHADMDPLRFELFWYMKYSRFKKKSFDQHISRYLNLTTLGP